MVPALAALMLAGCDYLRPFEQVCEQRLGPARVRVAASPTQLRQDFTQSSAALTARGAQSTGRLVLGVTEANLKSSVTFGGNGVVKPLSGRYCTRPAVNVTLAYNPMVVYVAREHPPGSCAHDLTLNHEMKHVRLYERFIDELTGDLETELRALLGDRIHYFSGTAEGERRLDAMISEKTATVIRAAMRGAQQLQADLDSPEEYGRLDLMQSKCTG